MRPPRHRKAFTLIELLVVIAIIAILTGLIATALNIARKGANNAKAKAEMGQLTAALEMYADKWGEYPPDNAQITTRPYPYSAGDPTTTLTLDSGQCLVFHLGAEFESGKRPRLPWDRSRIADFIATKSHGPFFEFKASRLSRDGHVQDPWGSGGGRTVWYYQFDNNQQDRGLGVCNAISGAGEWKTGDGIPPAPTGANTTNNWNVTNWNPDGVDIWCAGPDGVDMVVDNTTNDDEDIKPGGDTPGGADDDWEVDRDSPDHYRDVMNSIKSDSDDILGPGH